MRHIVILTENTDFANVRHGSGDEVIFLAAEDALVPISILASGINFSKVEIMPSMDDVALAFRIGQITGESVGWMIHGGSEHLMKTISLVIGSVQKPKKTKSAAKKAATKQQKDSGKDSQQMESAAVKTAVEAEENPPAKEKPKTSSKPAADKKPVKKTSAAKAALIGSEKIVEILSSELGSVKAKEIFPRVAEDIKDAQSFDIDMKVRMALTKAGVDKDVCRKLGEIFKQSVS